MSDPSAPTVRTPTVYFIDDSATMREVIKIALRKENIHVVTCSDAASALAQFAVTPPDAVITDVIMPDRDGYEVCEFIKQHEQFAKTPVILMSGIVNRAVAERASAVGADELVRKPFQPQELIARVKKLLNPEPAGIIRAEDLDSTPAASARRDLAPLRSVFAATAQPGDAVADSLRPSEGSIAVASHLGSAPRTHAPSTHTGPLPSVEVQKLRSEIRRLELVIKRLQAELDAQREYCAALEAHVKTLQEAD
jgi:CheY-like chemotaxis protein